MNYCTYTVTAPRGYMGVHLYPQSHHFLPPFCTASPSAPTRGVCFLSPVNAVLTVISSRVISTLARLQWSHSTSRCLLWQSKFSGSGHKSMVNRNSSSSSAVFILMAALKTTGDWLQGSGLVQALVQAEITSAGTADSFLRASHISQEGTSGYSSSTVDTAEAGLRPLP